MIDSGKVLFIAHRRELLDQTAEKQKQHLPGLAISIDQGERRADQAAQVILASIQSLSTRKEAYRPDLFSLIVCDECHRALAPSWVEVIEHFHDERDGNALLLGMTATPRRTDGRSALDLFDLVAYEIARPELQDLGYLVPIQYWGVKAALSLDQVKRSGGDFQIGALSAVMDTPHLRELTLRAWEGKAKGRKTLVFCASVRHAHRLAADFSSQGHRAEVLDSRTRNREEILDRFRRGDIELLLNYGVLTEGFDDPSIQRVLLACRGIGGRLGLEYACWPGPPPHRWYTTSASECGHLRRHQCRQWPAGSGAPGSHARQVHFRCTSGALWIAPGRKPGNPRSDVRTLLARKLSDIA